VSVARSNGNEPLVPIGEVEFRSGHSEQRALAFLEHANKRIHSWWDGSPCVSWKDAAWVVHEMNEADERQRREDIARGEALARQLEAERAEAQRRAAERQRRPRLIGGVVTSKPRDAQDWAGDE
jgi:hypothetical protein